MSIIIQLPDGIIELQRAKTTEDASSHIQSHNLNMEEIEQWLISIKTALETIASQASTDSSSISNTIANEKRNVVIPVNLLDGHSVIDANLYQVERVGVPSGGTSDSVEYLITDTDATRNTNFLTSIGVSMKELTGKIVYPTIIPNLTNIRIIFADSAEIEPTIGHTGTVSTDPNTKVVSWI